MSEGKGQHFTLPLPILVGQLHASFQAPSVSSVPWLKLPISRNAGLITAPVFYLITAETLVSPSRRPASFVSFSFWCSRLCFFVFFSSGHVAAVRPAGVFPPLTDSGSIYSQMPRPRERSTIWRSGRMVALIQRISGSPDETPEKWFGEIVFVRTFLFFLESSGTERCKLLLR